ncbi:hypothetical protein LCGC14_2384210 [marine sediment metagenome]|uniref:NAD-dependent epimerase/dehydratase domain-containing protein n=1 Tax=marine sediment metagenome TaxID=412755 RepID=A0A0F9CM62_9ZZZZ
MNYLILGSAGQIGSALTTYLKDKGHDVTEFDLENYSVFKQDLRYPSRELESILSWCDFVFFLAFDVGGSRYLDKYQNTYSFISNNIKIMDTTFDALRATEKPFIFASSQMSNMHHSLYGVCKAIGEAYTKALNGLIVKFWNVYGVEKDLSKAHVITDFISMAKEGRINMLTDGSESREFLYVEDACKCLEILSKKYNEISRDINLHITSGVSTKIINIADIIQSIIPCEITPSTQKDSVQGDKKNQADFYIRRFWGPSINITTGIRRIISAMEKGKE